MDSNGQPSTCGVQPSIWFLLGTLLFTSLATAMLCGAIMTDHWEHISWDRDKLNHIDAMHRNASQKRLQQLDWLLDGLVARVRYDPKKGGQDGEAFLVPMHGGIWTLCVSLTDEERQLLERDGFTQIQCINYLDPEFSRGEEGRTIWQHRMQNLSISCSLVCLIIMGSSALVGAFGVFKHQISAVLVTGVMYLLAATFAMFTLTIIHFKRHQSRPRNNDASAIDGVGVGPSTMLADGVSASTVTRTLDLDPEFLAARIFSTNWSLDLGWGGVTLCVLTSVLWILLSKIMRYNPLSPQIT